MKTRILRKGFIWRVLLLATAWWLLTGGALSSWVLGIPAVLLGLLAIAYLPPIPPFHFSFLGAAGFILYFLKQSLLAGCDVALRAFRPELPLDPGLITYHPRLNNDLALILFANSISLLPGTLSASLGKGRVLVHTLDENDPIHESLRDLEEKVGKMFCEDLE